MSLGSNQGSAADADDAAKGLTAMTPAENAIYLRVIDMCQKCHDIDNDPISIDTYWPQSSTQNIKRPDPSAFSAPSAGAAQNKSDRPKKDPRRTSPRVHSWEGKAGKMPRKYSFFAGSRAQMALFRIFGNLFRRFRAWSLPAGAAGGIEALAS